jgi:hypothetical protein
MPSIQFLHFLLMEFQHLGTQCNGLIVSINPTIQNITGFFNVSRYKIQSEMDRYFWRVYHCINSRYFERHIASITKYTDFDTCETIRIIISLNDDQFYNIM